VLSVDPSHIGATFLAGEAYRYLRFLSEAEHYYRRALQLKLNHSPSWSALATVLFDQLRFDEALTCINRSVRIDPCNSEAYFIRGMLRERRQDDAGAERDFLRAFRLEPDIYPMRVALSNSAIFSLLGEAMEHAHPTIKSYLSNVPIVVEEIPSADICLLYDPPAPPSEIVGHFCGTRLLDRNLENPWSCLPSTLVLYRRNMERIAGDKERILHDLQMTLFYEVGEFLGLEDEEMPLRDLA